MAVTTDKLLSNIKVTQYVFDPDATTATDIGWVDMRDFDTFVYSFLRTVGTGVLTYKIIANSASDGSDTDVVIKTGTATPDAEGDYAFLSCTAQEIAQLGTDNSQDDLRYVSANLTFATGTDEGVVTYILGNPKRAYTGLTADSIA